MGMRRRARRRGLVAGAVVGGAIAHNRAKQPQYDEAPVDDSEVQYAPPPADPADQTEHRTVAWSGALTKSSKRRRPRCSNQTCADLGVVERSLPTRTGLR